MASPPQPKPAAFTAEDIFRFRVKEICNKVFKDVLHQVLSEDIKTKPKCMGLFEFYEKHRNVKVEKFKKCLDKNQIKLIENDSEGGTFDVTLLFKCIQWGSDDVLADKNDDKWKEGNDSLESFLTTIKNKRNDIVHKEPAYDKQKFLDTLADFKRILTKILELTGTKYSVPKPVIDKKIADMTDAIKFIKNKPFIPQNHVDYAKQNLFLEHSAMVRKSGKDMLLKLYDSWVIITPISYMYELEFKVKKIFTEMVLVNENVPTIKQHFDDILAGINYAIDDRVLLIEGIAGVGKTTLTKKILSDWISGRSTMKKLNGYDLLLYTECRNNSIQSFSGLITALMREIAKEFKDDDFMNVVLNLKVIIIMDGLDELNSSSTKLFQEVLNLKKTCGLTVLLTTRPEKLSTYYRIANGNNIKTKHIKLIGIPKEKRDEFVIKYHDEMKKAGISNRDIDSLLEFLNKTALRLEDLWMLPYNLVLLVIGFVEDPDNIFSISTAPELYWKICHLILSKLIGRLLKNDLTRAVPEVFLTRKTEYFSISLSNEALVGLKKDDINLPRDSYERLVDICIKESLPPDEMIGAFLKKIVIRTPFGFDTRHSFPHKGLQEFLGALKIFKQIVGKPETPDAVETQPKPENDCEAHSLPSENWIEPSETMSLDSQDAAASNSAGTQQISTVIRDILLKVPGPATPDMTKFQNLFVTLIGMFSLESEKIQESTKREALELLLESGVKHKDDWLMILKAVKCDAYVAKFIGTISGILEGGIRIEDVSLVAYSSLLQGLQHIPVNSNMEMSLDVKGEFSELAEVLEHIRRLQLKISLVRITNSNFMEYWGQLEKLRSLMATDNTLLITIQKDSPVIKEFLHDVIKRDFRIYALDLHCHFRKFVTDFSSKVEVIQILNRDGLERYTGAFIPQITLPATLNHLRVSLGSMEEYNEFHDALKSRKIKFLHCCVSPEVPYEALRPNKETGILPNLYLPDLTSTNYLEPATTGKARRAFNTRKKVWRLYFPRCSLTAEEISTLLDNLFKAKVRVGDIVYFPSCLKPTTLEDEIRHKAITKLGAKRGVEWGFEDEHLW